MYKKVMQLKNTERTEAISMTYTIDMLIDKIKDVGKSYDLDKIQAAYELAEKAHDGVFRSSGEPYITHPVAVAYILVEQFCMDTDTICAALLHDVVEDTDVGLDVIQKNSRQRISERYLSQCRRIFVL